jgi:hypothetical protein
MLTGGGIALADAVEVGVDCCSAVNAQVIEAKARTVMSFFAFTGCGVFAQDVLNSARLDHG